MVLYADRDWYRFVAGWPYPALWPAFPVHPGFQHCCRFWIKLLFYKTKGLIACLPAGRDDG